ncbi:hypothetical protein AB0465_21650 [Streptomyces griseoviridis]
MSSKTPDTTRTPDPTAPGDARTPEFRSAETRTPETRTPDSRTLESRTPEAKGSAARTSAGRTPASGAAATKTAAADGSASGASSLLAREESDKLGQQLQSAVASFVDEPRASVAEADQVLAEIADRFTEAVTERRRHLRTSWRDGEGDDTGAGTADTEQLRLALRDYRELADRLLHS